MDFNLWLSFNNNAIPNKLDFHLSRLDVYTYQYLNLKYITLKGRALDHLYRYVICIIFYYYYIKHV